MLRRTDRSRPRRDNRSSIISPWLTRRIRNRCKIRSVTRLKVVITQQVIEIRPALHLSEQVLLASSIMQRLQRQLSRMHRRSKGRQRVNRRVVPELPQVIERDKRATTELGHIGQERSIDGFCEAQRIPRPIPGLRGRSCRRRAPILPCPSDRRVETFDGSGVGPRHDHEIGIVASRHGRSDLGRHRLGIDQ